MLVVVGRVERDRHVGAQRSSASDNKGQSEEEGRGKTGYILPFLPQRLMPSTSSLLVSRATSTTRLTGERECDQTCRASFLAFALPYVLCLTNGLHDLISLLCAEKKRRRETSQPRRMGRTSICRRMRSSDPLPPPLDEVVMADPTFPPTCQRTNPTYRPTDGRACAMRLS